MHDLRQKQIIPLAEFVTTLHGQDNVTKRLDEFKSILQTHLISKNPFADVVVTDMSWTLINSTLKVFNNCTALEYLIDCYEHIQNAQQYQLGAYGSNYNVKIYLCSTHVLKNMKKKIKKVKKASKEL